MDDKILKQYDNDNNVIGIFKESNGISNIICSNYIPKENSNNKIKFFQQSIVLQKLLKNNIQTIQTTINSEIVLDKTGHLLKTFKAVAEKKYNESAQDELFNILEKRLQPLFQNISYNGIQNNRKNFFNLIYDKIKSGLRWALIINFKFNAFEKNDFEIKKYLKQITNENLRKKNMRIIDKININKNLLDKVSLHQIYNFYKSRQQELFIYKNEILFLCGKKKTCADILQKFKMLLKKELNLNIEISSDNIINTNETELKFGDILFNKNGIELN